MNREAGGKGVMINENYKALLKKLFSEALYFNIFLKLILMIVYKNRVQPDDCDIYQHMNTLKYMEKFYEAADEYL